MPVLLLASFAFGTIPANSLFNLPCWLLVPLQTRRASWGAAARAAATRPASLSLLCGERWTERLCSEAGAPPLSRRTRDWPHELSWWCVKWRRFGRLGMAREPSLCASDASDAVVPLLGASEQSGWGLR